MPEGSKRDHVLEPFCRALARKHSKIRENSKNHTNLLKNLLKIDDFHDFQRFFSASWQGLQKMTPKRCPVSISLALCFWNSQKQCFSRENGTCLTYSQTHTIFVFKNKHISYTAESDFDVIPLEWVFQCNFFILDSGDGTVSDLGEFQIRSGFSKISRFSKIKINSKLISSSSFQGKSNNVFYKTTPKQEGRTVSGFQELYFLY